MNSLPTDRANRQNSYALMVRVNDGHGNLEFINTHCTPMLTEGHPTDRKKARVDAVKSALIK